MLLDAAININSNGTHCQSRRYQSPASSKILQIELILLFDSFKNCTSREISTRYSSGIQTLKPLESEVKPRRTLFVDMFCFRLAPSLSLSPLVDGFPIQWHSRALIPHKVGNKHCLCLKTRVEVQTGSVDTGPFPLRCDFSTRSLLSTPSYWGSSVDAWNQKCLISRQIDGWRTSFHGLIAAILFLRYIASQSWFWN